MDARLFGSEPPAGALEAARSSPTGCPPATTGPSCSWAGTCEGAMNLDDVAAICGDFGEVAEIERHGRRAWSVAGKVFAWERPFSKADLKRFGEATPPADPVVAVRLEDLEETRAVLAEQRPGVFTIQHFQGYPAVLVELAAVPEQVLRETLLDGWLACAPARLTDAYLDRDA